MYWVKRRSVLSLAWENCMPFKPHIPKPYPYSIPPAPELDPEIARKLDRHDVLRFFQIEGLLRSEVVWGHYHQATLRTRRRRTAPMVTNLELWLFLFGENRLMLRGGADAPMRRLLWDESLRERFNIDDGWAVLLGSHHRYLRPRKPVFRIGEGIVDLSLLHQSRHLEFRLEYLEERHSRNLYLMIDTNIVSSSDLAALKEVIRQRRKQLQISDTGRQKALTIKNPSAWLSYLRCYDFREREGLSRDEVGKRMHWAPGGRSVQARIGQASARREVTRAVRNVKLLIAAAEKGPWVFSHL